MDTPFLLLYVAESTAQVLLPWGNRRCQEEGGTQCYPVHPQCDPRLTSRGTPSGLGGSLDKLVVDSKLELCRSAQTRREFSFAFFTDFLPAPPAGPTYAFAA